MDGVTDLRTLEKASIRSFVESCSEHFTGRVLDYGCGDRPYEQIVRDAGGDYWGHDDDYPGAGDFVREQKAMGSVYYTEWDPLFSGKKWDALLVTQVIQYLPEPADHLDAFYDVLEEGGVLVLTYPTTWPEVEEADLHRFTRAGMTRLLVNAGFVIERHERRAEIEWRGEVFALGYGVVCRA